MTKRQTRMLAVAVVVAGVSLAAALGFMAFRKNLMAFYTPTDLVAGAVRPGTTLQLGGLVQPGSLQRGEQPCRNRLPAEQHSIEAPQGGESVGVTEKPLRHLRDQRGVCPASR